MGLSQHQMSKSRQCIETNIGPGHLFLWIGQGLPSLQYRHFSSVTGGIAFTIRPYFRLGT